MADSSPPNPNPRPPPFPLCLLPASPVSLSPPPPPPSPPPPPPSPPPPHEIPPSGRRFFADRRPALRVTSEFDSDTNFFFHKVSCKLFDSLAKLKLTFQNDPNGQISYPQLGFFTKHFSALYDHESRNALLKGSFDVGGLLQVRATHDVKTGPIGEPKSVHIGLSAKSFSVSCTYDNNKPFISSFHFGSVFRLKYNHAKEQQGEVALIANLLNPSYKLEMTSPVPSTCMPRASLLFPLGEVSVEERKDKEDDKALSISGILKGHLLNGVCTAVYKDEDLNLRYCYKDEEMTFVPSISLPSNAVSLAFKRQFSPADKLSYWYHFDSNQWSTVYKHTVGKDLKFKAGYDSEVRLGWASIWVGDEDGKAKTAPMKMKLQFMVQVPQNNINESLFLFRVKKRWDF